MRGLLLASVVFAAAATPVLAADVMVTPPPDMFDWARPYVGVQLGGAFTAASYNAPNVGPAINGFGTGISAVAGVHAGVNTMVGSFLGGVEGDIEISNFAANDGGAGGVVDTIASNWQASARLRVGIPADKLLIYGTAGIAVMDLDYALDAAAPGGAQVQSRALLGLTAGLGVELAVTDAMTLRGEVRYSNFGISRFVLDGNPVNTRDLSLGTTTARVGASWLF